MWCDVGMSQPHTQSRLVIMVGHISIPPMMLSFVAGLIVVLLHGPWWSFLLILLGVPLQMFNEYSLHRHIFHLPPPKQQWKFDLLYQAHYGHHDFPTNIPLFFAPAWISLPVLVVNFITVWILAKLVAPEYSLVIPAALVLVGGVGTFLAYEWFHMTAHLPVRKTWIERHVTGLHAQHHFRDFKRWFHVSPGGIVIDRLMGTAIDRNELMGKQRIEFIKTLGLNPDDPRLIAARNRFADKYQLNKTEIEEAQK
jgi:hypothetical protein